MQRFLTVIAVVGGLFFLQNSFQVGARWASARQNDTTPAAPGQTPTTTEDGTATAKAVTMALTVDRRARTARLEKLLAEAVADGGDCKLVPTGVPEEHILHCVGRETVIADHAPDEHLRDGTGFQPVTIR